MRRILISAFLCLASLVSNAIGQYSCNQLAIGRELEGQSLTTLAKDSFGRLWAGSNAGVSIISNGNVTNVKDVCCEGNRIALGRVLSIVCCESALIATEESIIQYDTRSDTARLVRHDGAVLNTESILLEGSIATFFDRKFQAFFSYDLSDGRCRILNSLPDGSSYSFSKIARYENDSMYLYLADDKRGIFRFNRKSGQLEAVIRTEGNILSSTMAIDNSGIIWIAACQGGVEGYSIKDDCKMTASYSSANCDLPDKRISDITPLPDGNLLIGHYGAGTCIIYRNNVTHGRTSVKQIENVRNVSAAITNPHRREILFATENMGLISLNSSFFGQIQHMHEQNMGTVCYENYLSAYEEPEGTILLGTSEFGIKRLDPDMETEVSLPGTSGIKAVGMFRFDDENILIHDMSGSLILFNRKTCKSSDFSGHPVADIFRNSQSDSMRLFETANGDFYIFNAGSKHYAYSTKRRILTELSFETEQNDGMVSNVCSTSTAVYVSISGSIIEINDSSLQTRLIYRNIGKEFHNITSMTATSVGELYFTETEGLYRFDTRSYSGQLIVPAIGTGRFFNAIADRQDRVWFSTDTEYIQMYNPKTDEILLYGIEDGITPSGFLNSWAICTVKGVILQPNASGIQTINTEGNLMTDTQPEPIICLKADMDGRAVSKSTIDCSVNRPFAVRPNVRNLNVEISANSFNPYYTHYFLYSLYRNSELVMRTNTMSTVLKIPKLEYGIYTLEIQQTCRTGLSEPQKTIRFKVVKPFTSTLPGILLILIVISLFGYTIALISSKFEKNKMGKAMAEQSNRNREEKIAFLSNIAHELRTPLSLIYNPVKDFLQEKSVDGIDYERMERIFNQVNKMTVMVNMILDSSRADVNKADILVEETNLNDWVNFLLEDYRIDCYAKGFTLKFLMDQSIGIVSIDRRIIETGLSNMVNNAIKYSNSGTTITVTTKRTDDAIRIYVTDQGRGFTCDAEDLFKRYYRENDDNAIPGYGLGLPYAKLQLSLIGGNMSAMHNEDGVGSTFYIEFPENIGKNGFPERMDNNREYDRQQNGQSAAADMEEGMAQDFDTRDMTLMFVSTDAVKREKISESFQDQFRLVITADNGQEALDKLKRINIDIVVSDTELAGTDGFEMCQAIKNDIGISHLPVILLTSRTDIRNRNIGYKMGADAFLPRPFEQKQLFNMIRSQLGGRFEIKRQYTFGYFSMMSPDQTFSPADEKFISSVNELISESISDIGLSDDTIHVKLGIPHTVLLKKMEGLLGTNMAGYIRRVRVGLVAEKLAGTDESMESVAAQTGFESVKEMENIFKKETGKDIHSIRQT